MKELLKTKATVEKPKPIIKATEKGKYRVKVVDGVKYMTLK